jgi:hypothetical protein
MRDSDTLDEGSFLRNNWPYLAMLALSIIGVALTSVAPVRMKFYWELLVPVFGIITFFVQRDPETPILTAVLRDVLHWGAVLVAMWLLMIPSVADMLNLDGISLMLLTVLALGTFTAALQAWSWRLGIIGIFLGLCVPMFAWLERSSLLVTLIVLIVGVVAALIWVKRG